MLRLGCFVLLVVVVLGLDTDAEWDKFKSTYNKKYSAEEEPKKKEIFKQHLSDIEEHNAKYDKGEVSFKQGVNKYTDMDHDEFVKNMNGVKGHRTHKRTDRVYKPKDEHDSKHEFDWRKQNVVSPIKDQGSTCGDCWAFSATGAIESAWAIANGNLVVLSDQQLTDCANNSQYDCDGCNGGWPDLAMQYVIDNQGQDTEACYPDLFTQNAQCNYQPSCMAVTISSYVDITPGNEHHLKKAVEEIGPISVCMDAGQPDFQNYIGGIYHNPNCSQTIDHAVLVIGFGHEHGKDFWLLKNSWGTSWGEKGFFKLARNHDNLCGITNDASYPVV